MRHALFLALVLAAAPAPLVAADFATGLRAYEAGDYAIALEQWAPLANAGDADAAFGLGLIFDNGHGVSRDTEAAAVWYQRAAEAGHVGAAYNLGNLWRAPDGPGPDPAEAARWWRVAAEAGLALAQLNLGVAYQKGDGVDQDDRAALDWYLRAAEQGEPTGAYFLGVAYENGVGTATDVAEALRWYRAAAAGGEPRAAERLAELGGVVDQPVPEPAPAEPAPAVAAAAPEPVPAPVVGGHYVQLAAFLSERRAEQAWAELSGRHADLLGASDHRVERAVKDDGSVVFRVHAGPLAEADADALCAALAARGAECFVVSR